MIACTLSMYFVYVLHVFTSTGHASGFVHLQPTSVNDYRNKL